MMPYTGAEDLEGLGKTFFSVADRMKQFREERDEARALADLAIEKLIAMQMTGVAADLAKRRTWEPAAAPSAAAGVEELPTLDELHGSDPGFTGEMTTAEYIAHIRGYKPAAEPSAATEER